MPPSEVLDHPVLFRDGPDGVHLLASRCSACGATSFPVAAICPECQGTPDATVELSHRGAIYAVTVVRVRPPDYAGPVPYGLGLVELPEGLRVFSVLLADDLDALTIGTEVEAGAFELDTDPRSLSYAFRPVGGQ